MDQLPTTEEDHPRCYQCGKNLKNVKKPKKDLRKPIKRSLSGMTTPNMIVSSSDYISEQEILVSFCGMECQTKGLNDFRYACQYLRNLKEDISKMLHDLQNGDWVNPHPFNQYDLLHSNFEDHQYCSQTFNKSTCRHFEDEWPEEAIRSNCMAILPSKMIIGCSFDGTTTEKTQYYKKSEFYEKDYLKMIIEKITYAYAIGELANRTNSKQLHQLHIGKMCEVIRSSSWGFCLILVSLTSSLLNLNRVDEAYNIILWQIFAKKKSNWIPVFKNLAPPDWFLGKGFSEVEKEHLQMEGQAILPKFEEMEKVLFADLKKDLNAIEEFHDRDEVTTSEDERHWIDYDDGYIGYGNYWDDEDYGFGFDYSDGTNDKALDEIEQDKHEIIESRNTEKGPTKKEKDSEKDEGNSKQNANNSSSHENDSKDQKDNQSDHENESSNNENDSNDDGNDSNDDGNNSSDHANDSSDHEEDSSDDEYESDEYSNSYNSSEIEFDDYIPSNRAERNFRRRSDFAKKHKSIPMSFYIMIFYIKYHTVQRIQSKLDDIKNFNETMEYKGSFLWQLKDKMPHVAERIESYLICDKYLASANEFAAEKEKLLEELMKQKAYYEIIKKFFLRWKLYEYILQKDIKKKEGAIDFCFYYRPKKCWNLKKCVSHISKDSRNSSQAKKSDFYFGSGRMATCWERFPELKEMLKEEFIINEPLEQSDVSDDDESSHNSNFDDNSDSEYHSAHECSNIGFGVHCKVCEKIEDNEEPPTKKRNGDEWKTVYF